jgi:NADH:ubiquinone oxidoreductase subunit C
VFERSLQAAPPPAPQTGPPPAPQAAPEVSRTRALADRLVASFPSTRVVYTRERRLKVMTNPGEIVALATFVRDSLGFDHIEVMGGTDYPATNEFEVYYFVGCVSDASKEDLVVQVAERVSKQDCKVPSLIEVWRGAEYHERETFDMLGIVFEGHPDLRRILLPEDWNDIPPLRKDYTNPGH